MSASSLIDREQGGLSCFYCGDGCVNEYDPPSSFTGWSEVVSPGSRAICNGCAWQLNERREIPWKDKPQKTRNYSWLIERNKQTPLTKANKSEIAKILLTPPPEPWAMALADSGQKHLIYRTPVNHDNSDELAVLLETEVITYDANRLRDRIDLAKQIVAAVGHKGAASPSVTLAIAASGELAQQWLRVIDEPITKLALFICPSTKECRDEINGTQRR